MVARYRIKMPTPNVIKCVYYFLPDIADCCMVGDKGDCISSASIYRRMCMCLCESPCRLPCLTLVPLSRSLSLSHSPLSLSLLQTSYYYSYPSPHGTCNKLLRQSVVLDAKETGCGYIIVYLSLSSHSPLSLFFSLHPPSCMHPRVSILLCPS